MLQVQPSSYSKISSMLHDVEFNCLFARSVLEGLADGEVWAESEVDPTLIHIIHCYGMSLLLIRSEQIDWVVLQHHLDACRHRRDAVWMQVHPIAHASLVDFHLKMEPAPSDGSVSSSRIQRHTRSNFTFERERYVELGCRREMPRQFHLRKMSAGDFALSGVSVSPHRFWRNASEFLAHGGGYCVTVDEQVASMAFASFRLDDQLEIGVETFPAYRGMGLAKHAAAALIDECCRYGLQPVWSCRKQNVASFSLALALGFSPTFEGPYYCLPRENGDGGN